MEQSGSDPTIRIPDDLPEDSRLSYRPKQEGDAAETDTAGYTLWSVEESDAKPAEQPPAPKKEPTFHLHRLLGQGGMGEVWEAIQLSLQRVVAIKRIRRNYLQEEAQSHQLDRKKRLFRDEALIAAQLEHPNIVPVHDFGTDDDGNVMLAMKRVDGQPWDDVLLDDWDKLSPEEFLDKHLAILIDVAQAVAFTHSRKIIHRDLKPGQVMIGRYGEVLLMDWGLALFVGEPQELQQELATPAIPTRESAQCPSGTPALMAPEQTRPDGMALGTWTDIYLLGGILYYILTGSFPHEARNAREAIRRAAKGEVEPPEKRAPDRTIPDELSRLCMNCLEREPANRTSSAEEFLAALYDYTTGRTRRVESIRITDAAKSLLDETPRQYSEFADIQHELNRAILLWPQNPDVPSLRDHALAGHTELAMKNGDLRLARNQADSVQDSYRRDELRREIESLENIKRRRERQRQIAIAAVFALLVVIVLGSVFFNRQLATERDFALAQQDRAESSRDRALGLIQFLHEDQRGALEAHGHLGLLRQNAEQTVKFFEELPEEEFTPTVRLAHANAILNLGVIESKEGDNEAGLAHFKDANKRFEALKKIPEVRDEANAGILVAAANEAQALRLRGEFDEAETLLKSLASSPAAPPDARDLQSANTRLGLAAQRYHLLASQGRMEEAAEFMDAELAALRPVVDAHPEATEFLRAYTQSMEERTYVDMDLGETERAAERLIQAAKLWEIIAEQAPDDARVKVGLASNQRHLGNIQARQFDYEEAEQSYNRSLEINQALVDADPMNADHQEQLAVLHQRIADMYRRWGKFDQALHHVTTMKDMHEQMLELDVENKDLKSQLGWAWETLGEVHRDAGNFDEAINSFQRAASIYTELAADEPADSRHHFFAAIQPLYLADVEATRGNSVEEMRLLNEAAKKITAMGESAAKQPFIRQTQAIIKRRLGEPDSAIDMLNAMISDGIDDSDIRREIALAKSAKSDELKLEGNHAEAGQLATEAVNDLKSLTIDDPENLELQYALGRAIERLIRQQYGARMNQAAIANLEDAMDIAELILRREPGPQKWKKLMADLELLRTEIVN